MDDSGDFKKRLDDLDDRLSDVENDLFEMGQATKNNTCELNGIGCLGVIILIIGIIILARGCH